MDIPTRTCTTPRLTYICPHCSGVLDLTPLVPPPSTAADAVATPSPLVGQAHGILNRWPSIGRALRQVATPGSTLPGLPRRLRWWLYALLLLPLLGVLVWQQWVAPASSGMAAPVAALNPSTTSTPRSATASVVAEQAAVLAVVAAYNAAEAEVAQTLAITPIMPLLEPNAPLAQRRAQELTLRQRTHATHATRLLRWAIGAITIDPARTTATVTTQETWDDQIGSQLSRTATVRVVYTLRRADIQSAWRIADAQSTLL